jgi:hypothetical protein
MKTFNLTAYENGKIIKTVKAISMEEAKNQLEAKGYDCQNDYFLETVEETARYDKMPNRTIYIDEER